MAPCDSKEPQEIGTGLGFASYLMQSICRVWDMTPPKKTLFTKSARAGKDIGTRGKNFSKIESKAAKRYGSKAAGKRVAGAALAKLRAEKK